MHGILYTASGIMRLISVCLHVKLAALTPVCSGCVRLSIESMSLMWKMTSWESHDVPSKHVNNCIEGYMYTPIADLERTKHMVICNAHV